MTRIYTTPNGNRYVVTVLSTDTKEVAPKEAPPPILEQLGPHPKGHVTTNQLAVVNTLQEKGLPRPILAGAFREIRDNPELARELAEEGIVTLEDLIQDIKHTPKD